MNAEKRTRGLLSSCLMLILIFSILTSCDISSIGSYIDPYQTQDVVETNALYIGGHKIIFLDPPERESPGYKALSDEQKSIYNAAFLAIQSGETVIRYTGVDYKNYFEIYGDAFSAMLYDHPEFFWLNGKAAASAEFPPGSDMGNVTIEMSVYDYWLTEDLDAARAEFDRTSAQIVSQAEKYTDLFDKVLYVHDHIVGNVRYDRESFESGDVRNAETDAFSNTAYGSLVKGSALCGGYARAFSHIMHRMGIESHMITGEANGGMHAWNVINLDNEYYYIDLTWDDTDGTPCEISYNYFCITYDEIALTHKANAVYDSISAVSDKYNYYIRKSLYLSEYSFDEVSRMYASSPHKNVFTFKCASESVANEAIRDLVDNHNLDKLNPSAASGNTGYYVDENLNIITFVFP